jgi:hypothetical protein
VINALAIAGAIAGAIANAKARLRAAAAWAWSHRTKAIGGIGTGASYAYLNQEQLGLFIPAKGMGFTMGAIGVATIAVGLYNTFFAPKQD